MEEEKKCKQASMLMWVLIIGLVSQNLVIPVMATAFEEKKNYYGGTPNTPSHGTPSHGSGGGSGGTPPYHSTPSNPPSPVSYDPTPSTPPGGNCGTPPTHEPSTPSTPSTPSSGGNCGTPSTPEPGTPSTPSTPSGGNCGTPPTHEPSTPSTPSAPPSGGGGYYPSPPTTGGGGTPPTPIIVSPPTTPTVPGSPPFVPDPNSPYTCNYWRTHPGIIWGLLGWWGTLGSTFGASSLPGFGAGMSLQQALSNTRTDGYGTLYREGTASLLNAMVSHNNRFPFTTTQVRESFMAALGSNKAAAAQGHIFKLANEGKLKSTP